MAGARRDSEGRTAASEGGGVARCAVLKRCLSWQFLAKHHPNERIVQFFIANRAGLHAHASCRSVQAFNRWSGTFPAEQRPNVLVSKDGQ